MGVIIIKLIVGVIIVAAFGGQGEKAVSDGAMVTGDAEIDKALDGMKFENAPTLGPLLRECMVAMYKGDGAFLWDNVSSSTRDEAQKILENVRKNPAPLDNMIKFYNNELANAETEEEKAIAQAWVDYFRTLKERLPDISARDYFIRLIEHMAKVSKKDIKTSILDDREEVVGEEIAAGGKSAVLKLKYVKSGQEEELRFVKEDGVWKLDMSGTMFP